MFYNARWYDTSIGRFAQADTIIPANQGVQAYDRYAYVNNSPVMHNDPSGHFCIGCVVAIGLGILTGLASYHFIVAPLAARGADPSGVDYVATHMSPDSSNLLVAGGIAVQSQWYNRYWDDPSNPAASSYGPAQLGEGEYPEGADPHNTDVAVNGMTDRINASLQACGSKCKDPTDAFIVAAMAQNGGGVFDPSEIIKDKNHDIDWAQMFEKRNPAGGFPGFREWLAGGLQYDTRFMLRLYINDIKALMEKGWNLPPGYENIDWEKLEKLASPAMPSNAK